MKIATLSVVLISSVVAMTGCSKKEEPAPIAAPQNRPTPANVEPEPSKPPPQTVETGTVKIEFDIAVDPKSIISISANDYLPKDLEQPISLKPGKHTIVVKQPGLNLPPQEFTVEKDQRRIVRVFEPNRKAAEWALAIGGEIHIVADGKQRQVMVASDLPQGRFTVTHIHLHQGGFTDGDLATSNR